MTWREYEASLRDAGFEVVGSGTTATPVSPSSHEDYTIGQPTLQHKLIELMAKLPVGIDPSQVLMLIGYETICRLGHTGEIESYLMVASDCPTMFGVPNPIYGVRWSLWERVPDERFYLVVDRRPGGA